VVEDALMREESDRTRRRIGRCRICGFAHETTVAAVASRSPSGKGSAPRCTGTSARIGLVETLAGLF